MYGYWVPNHLAIVLFLFLGVQGTRSLLRQFIHLLSVTDFRHSVSHRCTNKTTLLSHPCYNKQTGKPLQLVQLVRTGLGGLVCTNHCLDHRARTAMSSSLQRNKGKSGSEQVNHVSYCRSLPSLDSKGSHLT